MKSIVAVAIFCLLAVGTVNAQKENSGVAQKTEHTVDMDILAKQLGLTVKQRADVEKTVIAFTKTIVRLNNSTISAAEKSSKIAAVNSRMEKNIKTYLTEEQFKKYLTIKSEQKNL